MRVGEATALTWNDIDFENKTININKTFSKNVLDDSTKNDKDRVITIGDELVQVLKQHESKQLENKLDLVSNYANKGIVFANGIGKHEHHGNLRSRHFDKIIKKSILSNEITIHDLRHTFASINLMEGVPVLVVSNHLGHSSASITLDIYSHFISEVAESPSITFERVLKEANNDNNYK